MMEALDRQKKMETFKEWLSIFVKTARARQFHESSLQRTVWSLAFFSSLFFFLTPSFIFLLDAFKAGCLDSRKRSLLRLEEATSHFERKLTHMAIEKWSSLYYNYLKKEAQLSRKGALFRRERKEYEVRKVLFTWRQLFEAR